MELRAFLTLFVQQRNLIAGVVGVALVCGILGYRLQGQWYQGEVLLSVTRQGTEATTSYQYDQFYRLQADERMAETLARYLETEIGRRETARRVSFSADREREFVRNPLTALRLSSNLIQVSYQAATPVEADRIAAALLEVGEQYVARLNESARDKNWFTLVSSEVLARDGRFTLPFALGMSFLAGFFIAFWVVIGRWYWSGKPSAKQTEK